MASFYLRMLQVGFWEQPSTGHRVQAANDRKGEAKTSKLLAQIRLEKVQRGSMGMNQEPIRNWNTCNILI